MRSTAIILSFIFTLMVPAASLAAEQSLMGRIWNKVGGMRDVWVVAFELRRMEAALQDYETDTGKSLPPEAGLETLIQKGYLKDTDIKDPWGQPYRYRRSLDGRGGYRVHLTSAGPDGIHGTEDDLGN